MNPLFDSTVTGQSRAVGAAPRDPWRLAVVYPPALSGMHVWSGEALTVGRAEAHPNALSLPHGTVSRQHARLTRTAEGAAALVDLNSRNGTWLNGAAVGEGASPLALGDVLRFGDVIAVLEPCPLAAAEARAVDRAVVPGVSAAAVALRVNIARAAADPSPVLLVGETGSGKERVAREVHRLSRRQGAWVPLNCAELSGQLAESQLFGHERGAFTGAEREAPGVFRAAQGGTLLLDEIGELPIELQPKLLRVLQEREVRPVGRSKPVSVDVRVIAATHRDLWAAVDAGAFRRDLMARLALWEIAVPPLRERAADILDWLSLLWTAWHRQRSMPAPPLEWTPRAAEAVLLHPWPENLRGLERLVHRLAARGAQGGPVDSQELPLAAGEPGPAASPRLPERAAESPAAAAGGAARRQELPPAPDAEALRAALAANRGSVRATAAQFGRERRQIYRWMQAYGIERPPEEPDA
jgi:DNA-binding NtrC family response regulator